MNTFNHITKDKTPIIITSHPRSGTHLTIDLIRRQFPETIIKKHWGSNTSSFLSLGSFNALDDSNRLKEEDALKLIAPCKYPIIKMHTYGWPSIAKNYPHWMQWIREKGKLIYVARDIHSVMPSMHLYEQSFNPQARCAIKDFIRQPYLGKATRIHYWNDQILTWFNKPEFLSLRFEDILQMPAQTCEKIAQHTGLKEELKTPLLPPKVTSIWHARLQRIFSTNPNSTAIVCNYKGQKTRPWQDVFDSEDLDFIHTHSHKAITKKDGEISC